MTIEQLEMKHIAKSFESFQALQDVSFTVKKAKSMLYWEQTVQGKVR